MHPQPMNRGIEIASEVADGAAVGHPRPGAQRRRGAHGGAGRRCSARAARAHEPGARAAPSSSSRRGCSRSSPTTRAVRAAPGRAQAAPRTPQPGSFAHLTCDATIPMRRPLSIMRADPARRLDRDPLQGGRSWAAGPRRPQGRRCGERARARSAGRSSPHAERPRAAAARRRRRHPADGVPRRAPEGRPQRQAAGAHGLGSAVSVSHAPLDTHPRRHARRLDRLHAAAGGVGRAEPPGEPPDFPGCYSGLRDRAGARVA